MNRARCMKLHKVQLCHCKKMVCGQRNSHGNIVEQFIIRWTNASYFLLSLPFRRSKETKARDKNGSLLDYKLFLETTRKIKHPLTPPNRSSLNASPKILLENYRML